jgi:hypothetical protein
MRTIFQAGPFQSGWFDQAPRRMGQAGPVMIANAGFAGPWGGSFFASPPGGFVLPTEPPLFDGGESPEEVRRRGMSGGAAPRVGAAEDPPALSPVPSRPWYLGPATPAHLSGPGPIGIGPRWGWFAGRWVRWPECDPRYDAECPYPTSFVVVNPEPPAPYLLSGSSPIPVANLGAGAVSKGGAARGRELFEDPYRPCPPGFFRSAPGSPCMNAVSTEDWGEDYWTYGDKDRYVDAIFR